MAGDPDDRPGLDGARRGWARAAPTSRGSGLICDILGEEGGPVVALRADLDALPVPDEKLVAYRSTHAGTSTRAATTSIRPLSSARAWPLRAMPGRVGSADGTPGVPAGRGGAAGRGPPRDRVGRTGGSGPGLHDALRSARRGGSGSRASRTNHRRDRHADRLRLRPRRAYRQASADGGRRGRRSPTSSRVHPRSCPGAWTPAQGCR